MENYQTITSFVFISLRFLTASLLFHFDGGSRSWITSSVMVLTQAAVVFSHSMDSTARFNRNCLRDGHRAGMWPSCAGCDPGWWVRPALGRYRPFRLPVTGNHRRCNHIGAKTIWKWSVSAWVNQNCLRLADARIFAWDIQFHHSTPCLTIVHPRESTPLWAA